MTNEEKQLLLIDLCARLPHNVIIRCTDSDTNYKCFLTTDILHEIQYDYEHYDYKPYLRPMSSMTDEELSEYRGTCGYWNIRGTVIYENTAGSFDWLNARHFDYRGLIPMGLALEAPKDMYKTE